MAFKVEFCIPKLVRIYLRKRVSRKFSLSSRQRLQLTGPKPNLTPHIQFESLRHCSVSSAVESPKVSAGKKWNIFPYPKRVSSNSNSPRLERKWVAGKQFSSPPPPSPLAIARGKNFQGESQRPEKSNCSNFPPLASEFAE